MQEKVLDNKKNGMGMMVLFILLYAAAAAFITIGAMFYWIPLMVIGIIWLSLGWIPFCGLKVLKPQEALVRGNSEERWFLLGKSVLYSSEPGSEDQAEPER